MLECFAANAGDYHGTNKDRIGKIAKVCRHLTSVRFSFRQFDSIASDK